MRAIEQFRPGEVVLCVEERGAVPALLKGRLYHIAARIPGHEGYILEGVTPPPPFVGYWADRFEKVPGSWTYKGPIRRVRDARQ